ncbi:UPF0691 protein C9orf116 homolog isoform X2 [Rousettus aegyptiacus]|uniref:Uncharacterized protein n=1 Tax=Rousettus aegyptiacus TaxID=9407 RepID=A0A7J8IGA6_ROUAE|nr:UPF0691 protein C9orf116 homolog isoform X2 [Rousettus aegyptiacus]KAF6483341.1 hypothetical protein HJG63_001935 [Rousettus aegyptiacus]
MQTRGGGVHEITGAESALGVRCEHQVLACPAASQNSVRDEVLASALHLRRNPPSPPFGTMSGRDLRAMIARPALQPREVFDALLSPPARALASCREGSRPRLFDPAAAVDGGMSEEDPQECAKPVEPAAQVPPEKTSDYYGVAEDLPVRFNNPAWFRGYRTNEPASVYRTSNQTYGGRAPTVHEMPTAYSWWNVPEQYFKHVHGEEHRDRCRQLHHLL